MRSIQSAHVFGDQQEFGREVMSSDLVVTLSLC